MNNRRNTLIVIILSMGIIPSLQHALECSDSNCKIENNCRCSSTKNPIASEEYLPPQLVSITYSSAVSTDIYKDYLEPLLFNRTNHDGVSIGATFFVNHEYTDYEAVQKLYLNGFEIGSHSITKSVISDYWLTISKEDLVEEYEGQKEIISHFANIPISEIKGGRIPQMQLQGDVTIEAFIESGLSYDHTWPTLSTIPLLPYTLDYLSTQDCALYKVTCPKDSHPGFWVVPITNIQNQNNTECNSLLFCGATGNAQEISTWLMNQVERVRNGNRAPLNLNFDSGFFMFNPYSFRGFSLFLEEVAKLDDVFLVSLSDAIDWMKNPVPAKDYSTPIHTRQAECSPVTCELEHLNGDKRFMISCVPCPDVYPWKGNPLGRNQTLNLCR